MLFNVDFRGRGMLPRFMVWIPQPRYTSQLCKADLHQSDMVGFLKDWSGRYQLILFVQKLSASGNFVPLREPSKLACNVADTFDIQGIIVK